MQMFPRGEPARDHMITKETATIEYLRWQDNIQDRMKNNAIVWTQMGVLVHLFLRLVIGVRFPILLRSEVGWFFGEIAARRYRVV